MIFFSTNVRYTEALYGMGATQVYLWDVGIVGIYVLQVKIRKHNLWFYIYILVLVHLLHNILIFHTQMKFQHEKSSKHVLMMHDLTIFYNFTTTSACASKVVPIATIIYTYQVLQNCIKIINNILQGSMESLYGQQSFISDFNWGSFKFYNLQKNVNFADQVANVQHSENRVR